MCGDESDAVSPLPEAFETRRSCSSSKCPAAAGPDNVVRYHRRWPESQASPSRSEASHVFPIARSLWDGHYVRPRRGRPPAKTEFCRGSRCRVPTARCRPDRSGPKPARDRRDRCQPENQCHLPRRSDMRSEARPDDEWQLRPAGGTGRNAPAKRAAKDGAWRRAAAHPAEAPDPAPADGDSVKPPRPGVSGDAGRARAMHDPRRCLGQGAASLRTGAELPGSLLERAARRRVTAVVADRSRTPNPAAAGGPGEAKSTQQEVRELRLYREVAKTRRFSVRRARNSTSRQTE